jgi:hypothetical protein
MIEELIPVVGLYQALLIYGYNPIDIKNYEQTN